jgi:hypothetical protein
MRKLRVNGGRRAGIAAALLAMATLVGLLSAGPASAESRGFRIHNTSNTALKLEGSVPVPMHVCGNLGHCIPTHVPMEFEGRPSDGSTLQPGATAAWELKYGFSLFGGIQYASDIWYEVPGTSARVEFEIEVWSYTNESRCKVVGTSRYTCAARGLQLSFKDE